MTDARFLQIHSLHGYSAVLLNRDDSGLAKRLTYGGAVRTRISSQCLKRHWRTARTDYALDRIDRTNASVRSRMTVTCKVIQPLRDRGYADDVVAAIDAAFQVAVYGDKGGNIRNRQPLLLGNVEIDHLAKEARRIADAAGGNAGAAKKAAAEWTGKSRANMKAFRESTTMPGGIAAALFGRMVTSDTEANIDAAVHVAHPFTVHGEESESDYFTVVDDLQREEDGHGAAHINETELTAGLFYGYVVLDRETLLDNLGRDETMAGEVANRLIRLIATVSPGAKRGPTAPYGYAAWMLVEAGGRQPRSFAEAFRSPCAEAPRSVAEQAVSRYATELDRMYERTEVRRLTSLDTEAAAPGAERLESIGEMAEWAAAAVRTGRAD